MIKSGIQGLRVLSQYRSLLKTVNKRVPNADLDLIKRSFRFADHAHKNQKRLSGEPYIIHPLSVAHILAEQSLDSETIAAALLHDVVEDTSYGEETITSEFGEDVHALVKSVTKISAVKTKGTAVGTHEPTLERERANAENIRMMLMATARDVRVILIKLADKLHNMRTLEFHKTASRERIANEVLNIYAPIAGRMGMYRMKSELEDLAFLALKPEEFRKIRSGIHESQSEAEKFVRNISKVLQLRLAEINIKAKVEGRAKHNYSIYQKMISQGKELHEIYDLRGVRIIVAEIRDCYGALGIVHTLWPPIPGRFKDYVATPKINGYQSLHTNVVGPDGRPLEIQIRTKAMNDLADYGIASHWIYKNEATLRQTGLSKLHWLQRLSSLMEGLENTTEFIEDLRQELSPEDIYVFTPKGDIIDLPRGSTVLDFAFSIHTEIGLCCRGAMVNDRIVPLRTELKSGDRVKILTEKTPNPSPNWLRYIKSPRIRQKLRSHFRKKEDEQIPGPEPEQALDATGAAPDKPIRVEELRIRRRKTSDPKQVPIEVAGSRDIPVRYAGCCSPVPGDRIVGFVTRGRGVTVHRADCPMLPKDENEQKRIIAAAWEGLTEKYPVTIEINAQDRQGLYLDLVSVITRTYTNILKAEADIPQDSVNGMEMRARFILEVEHVDHLKDILDSLQAIPGVMHAGRVQEEKKLLYRAD